MIRNSIHVFAQAAVLALFALTLTGSASARIGVAITIAPPPLPVYEQPICPGDGYLWTPGYWAWGDDFDDYYWIPGTWVMGPEVGFLWTPGYWGWGDGGYFFNAGYWGPQIGFYGGIDYGFGYFGSGFVGGRWDNGHFFYNRAVLNVNVTDIHNVYNTTVEHENVNHVSFNGGNGGVIARPTPQEEAAAHDRHIEAVAAQTQHAQEAHSNPQQRASMNHGKPEIAATSKPGDFKSNVAKASAAGGNYTPAKRSETQPREGAGGANAGHVRDLPAAEKPAAPNTGNAKLDKKYQKQQDKQYSQQQKERQKLQQQQDKEDQKAAKQNNEAQKQQTEQRHQQQTQALTQRHTQQNQAMQQRMSAAAPHASGGRPR